ncbi:hypothetical protein [Mucilaginibacter sp. FT3.2]|uniref:hypothetical protein n=1 Tax=Mucilaginibacter sp. FT3.2 TaxID=2723090 RepID=UPI001622AE0D|nr:hypothetical protein [Mucilaginibacter sp. FT3.2]MBB6230129.1 hypothetical protein [Mucilaginibacter sp. FT3.2]
MILTTDELKWIDEQMKIYDIKYQEIYNEILDHIITAIEEKRKGGDEQGINGLFQQVVDEHFGGFFGVEKLAARQKDIYLQGVRRLWSKCFRYYINWQMLVFTLAAILISFKLPDVKAVRAALLVACILLAFSPLLHTHFSLSGKIKTIKGKQSLIKGHMISQAVLPGALFNLLMYAPQFVVLLLTDGDDNWNLFKQVPPTVITTILMGFVLLNLTAIRFCKQMMVVNSLT